LRELRPIARHTGETPVEYHWVSSTARCAVPTFFFLKIGLRSSNRIYGDGQNMSFPGWIELIGYGPVGPAGLISPPEGGPGKTRVSRFRFAKANGPASQRIFSACHAGEHFDAAALAIEGPGPRVRFLFEDVIIPECRIGHEGLDEFQLAFDDMKIAADATSAAAVGRPRGRSAQAASTMALAVASSLAPPSAPTVTGFHRPHARRV
jgi:hypothetical protein